MNQRKWASSVFTAAMAGAMWVPMTSASASAAKEPTCASVPAVTAAIGGLIEGPQLVTQGKIITCEYDQNPVPPSTGEADIDVTIAPLTAAKFLKVVKAGHFTKVSGFKVGAKAYFNGTTGDTGVSTLQVLTSQGYHVVVVVNPAAANGAGEPEQATAISVARVILAG